MKFCSLGANCEPAWQLRNAQIERLKSPFDTAGVPLRVLLSMLTHTPVEWFPLESAMIHGSFDDHGSHRIAVHYQLEDGVASTSHHINGGMPFVSQHKAMLDRMFDEWQEIRRAVHAQDFVTFVYKEREFHYSRDEEIRKSSARFVELYCKLSDAIGDGNWQLVVVLDESSEFDKVKRFTGERLHYQREVLPVESSWQPGIDYRNIGDPAFWKEVFEHYQILR